MSFETTEEFLLAAAVITAFNGIGVLFFLFLWLASLEKLGEYWRTLRQFTTIS